MPRTHLSTPKYAWVILFIAYMGAVAGSVIMDKIAPMLPILMSEFNIGLSRSGLLMSVFGFTGLALTLPAGYIIQRLGLKNTSAVAFGCLIVGAALGAVAGSFGLLLISRMLEGIGNVLIFILAPAAIAMWFPPEKSGLPLGIWSTATPLGSVLTLTIIPRLETTFGWRGAWWASAGFSLLVFLAFWFLIRPAPAKGNSVSEAHSVKGEISYFRELLSNRSIWLVALSWFCYVAVFASVNTYYPTYLTEALGFNLVRAGLLFSLVSFVRVLAGPLIGLVSDRVSSRKWVMVGGALLFLPIIVLLFQSNTGMIPILMVLLGLLAGVIPTMIFAAVPQAVGDPRMVPMGMAIIQFGFNLSLIAGPPVFGSLVENMGWSSASIIFAPVILLLVAAALLNKKVR